MPDSPHLMIAYDGSEQATEAIVFAARIFPHGTPATVLYAWEPALVAAGTLGMAAPLPDDEVEHEEPRTARGRRERSAWPPRARRRRACRRPGARSSTPPSAMARISW
jgi:hypothetical protein